MVIIGPTYRVSASALGLVSSAVETQDGAGDTKKTNTTDTTQIAKSTGYGSLLVPSTASNLLNLLAEVPAENTSATTFSFQRYLGKDMRLAAASSSEAPKPGQSNYYSQSDLDTIKAATGYNLVVMNGATAVVDDDGNPPPQDIAMKVSDLAARIEGDRAAGVYSGEVTSEYLGDLFKCFSSEKENLPPEWLNRAINYLQGQVSSSTSAA